MQAPNDEARELFYLEAHSDDLERTVKTDQIAADSGSVILSQRTCSYRRPIDTYPSSVQVLVQSATASEAFEVPQLIVEPHPDAALSLTSISIVRFLHADRQILFGAANYEAGGAIGSLQNGTMVNGELQPGSSISLRQAPNFERARLAVGLPSQIEIRDYLRSNRMPLLKTSASPVRTLVILIYGFGKLMRLDSLKDGIVTASRYLSPIGTTEERALDPVCDARFCEQLATGSGTVE